MSVTEKAQRLLTSGAVEVLGEGLVFNVVGDTGTYLVVISPKALGCSCPAQGTCSHIKAATQWVLADDNLRAEYERAVEARRRHLMGESRSVAAAVWDSATVSAGPPGVFYARIVWDGVPYTGAGVTHDAALSDLENVVGSATDLEPATVESDRARGGRR